jgi:predicted transcriptional regulator
MAQYKTFTVRLSADNARRAEFLARVDGVAVNEVFRLALESYVEVKKDDEAFMERAQAILAADARIMEEMA